MQRILSPKISETPVNIALLILRVTVGLLMANHGYGKIENFSEYSAQFMSFIGLSPAISLGLVVGAEFFCSLLLIVGLLPRFASIPLIITMAVAVFQAHDGDIFGKGEVAFLFFAVYIALSIAGAGKYSVDHVLFNRAKSVKQRAAYLYR
jgi:putative oxidoreductase